VNELVEATEPAQSGISNPYHQQEVSNQLFAADMPISKRSNKDHHANMHVRDPPDQQVLGISKEGIDDSTSSPVVRDGGNNQLARHDNVRQFLPPFLPEEEQQDLRRFVPESHDPSQFLSVEHHDPSQFLPVEHHDPSQFMLVERHDPSQFINPADLTAGL
jgi:hypothetical protein